MKKVPIGSQHKLKTVKTVSKTVSAVLMAMSTIIMLTVCSIGYLSIDGTAQNNIKINLFQLKYIGYDQSSSAYKLHANISLNVPGRLTYVEEYYIIDNNNNPKYSGSSTYYDGALVGDDTGTLFNASFEVPRSSHMTGYSLIRSIILLDNKMIYYTWLTENKDFVDNTPIGDDTISPLQNVDKFETREGRVIADIPTTFKYTSLGTIYEVNVTGKLNNDITLRIDLLKDTPSLTYKPNGVIYGYLDIIADSDSIKVLIPKYRIENSWIEANKIKGIGMIRWDSNNKTWIGLRSNVIDKDSKYIYIESIDQISAINQKLAIVGIVGNINGSSPKNTNTTNTTNNSIKDPIKLTIEAPGNDSNKTDQAPEEPLIKNIPGFQSVLAIAIFFIYFIVLKKRRK